MPDPNYTSINILLDRTGSMQSCRNDMVGALNNFLQKQKETPGKCDVSLARFDMWNNNPPYEEVFTEKALADIQILPLSVLDPRGNTNLLDAMAMMIRKVGERLAQKSDADRPGKVLNIIITDGEENASVEYRGPTGKQSIANMVKHQIEKYSWHFMYLGANQDAIKVARDYGIPRQAALSYDTSEKGLAGTSDVLNASVRRYRVSAPEKAIMDSAYTSEEREKATGVGVPVLKDDPDSKP